MADPFAVLAAGDVNAVAPYPDNHVYNRVDNGLLLNWRVRVQEKVLKKTDLPLYAHIEPY